MVDFYDVLSILGYLLRALGALVFGLGAGWLTLKAFRRESGDWRLPIAAFLGLMAAFVLIGHWVEGGATLGAFGLGAGAAVLAWGVAMAAKPAQGEETMFGPKKAK